MQLQNKVAFVTGAGSGIGKGAAVRMAQEGAKVAILSRTEKQLQDVAAEIEAAGSEALIITGDVSDADVMEASVQQIVDKWGRLDIVVANAGINGVWTSIEEMTPEEWDKTMDINLKGTFLTIKYATPHLKKAGRRDCGGLVGEWHAHV